MKWYNCSSQLENARWNTDTKDWVYDIQYTTTDIAGELSKIYDAQELYLELKNFLVRMLKA